MKRNTLIELPQPEILQLEVPRDWVNTEVVKDDLSQSALKRKVMQIPYTITDRFYQKEVFVDREYTQEVEENRRVLKPILRLARIPEQI